MESIFQVAPIGLYSGSTTGHIKPCHGIHDQILSDAKSGVSDIGPRKFREKPKPKAKLV